MDFRGLSGTAMFGPVPSARVGMEKTGPTRISFWVLVKVLFLNPGQIMALPGTCYDSVDFQSAATVTLSMPRLAKVSLSGSVAMLGSTSPR